MKKLFLAMMAFALAIFAGCTTEEPSIVCGRDWNAGSMVVADTTSEFDLADQMVVQFKYGKNFDFTNLKVAFYEGSTAQKGAEIWSRDVKVTEKMGVYTLQGKSRHGGMMLAREMCKHRKPGSVMIELSADGRVLATKDIQLVKTR